MQKSSNPASLHRQGGLPAPPSSGLCAFPGLHTPALGEVGAPALCSSPPPPPPRHTWAWVPVCCLCSVTHLAGCWLLPVSHEDAARPGFALALWGDCEWCCITLPVSSPTSLPTVTSFHTSCCFWSWLLLRFRSLLEVLQLRFNPADGSLAWSVLEKWHLQWGAPFVYSASALTACLIWAVQAQSGLSYKCSHDQLMYQIKTKYLCM